MSLSQEKEMRSAVEEANRHMMVCNNKTKEVLLLNIYVSYF